MLTPSRQFKRATTKLLFTEGSGLADDEVDLPARYQVNDVEQRLPFVSFQGRIQVHVVFILCEKPDQRSQLIQGC